MHTLVQLSGFGNTLLHYLLPFLFVLTVVVFVHELGHFLVARWCGVAIKTFSIGFGPEIVGFNDRYGTRWRLSWIPSAATSSSSTTRMPRALARNRPRN